MVEFALQYFFTPDSLLDFMALGGAVLWLVAFVSVLLSAMVLERLYYGKVQSKADLNVLARVWSDEAHGQQADWQKQWKGAALLAQQTRRSFAHLNFIKALVAVVPLLGLLGTITGMIEVFDVLSLTNSSNARAMASGLAKATLPTMAGMLIALLGLYFITLLKAQAEKTMRQCQGILSP